MKGDHCWVLAEYKEKNGRTNIAYIDASVIHIHSPSRTLYDPPTDDASTNALSLSHNMYVRYVRYPS